MSFQSSVLLALALQAKAQICAIDSGNVVLASASCAVSSESECGKKDHCEWGCPDSSSASCRSTSTNGSLCSGVEKKGECLKESTCVWQYCCQLRQESLDRVLSTASLEEACQGVADGQCTVSKTENACAINGKECAINQDRVIDSSRRSGLWTFTAKGKDLAAGPWPQTFLETYNAECGKDASCTGLANETFLTIHLTEPSIKHLEASLQCSAHEKRASCMADDCEWTVGVGEEDDMSDERCVLSPENAVLAVEAMESETCSAASLGVQLLCYGIFVLFVVACIMLDVKQNPDTALREWLGVFRENLVAIGCLAAFIVLYILAFLQEFILNGSNFGGLLITIFGLTIFSRGLATGLMPLAENVGRELPQKIAVPFVLIIVFFLGVLCTIAEPSIQALQAAGSTVSFAQAPFVKIVLSPDYVPEPGAAPQNWVFTLQIMVGVGVGIAAVIGTVRLVSAHGVKKYTSSTFIPPLLMTIIACLFFTSPPEHLDRSTGLSWDCGAVTTGPVTVPIVLAIGIGMAAASKAKRAALETGSIAGSIITKPLYASVNGSRSILVEQNTARRDASILTGGSLAFSHNSIQRDAAAALAGPDNVEEAPNLDGFGIVTFASLLPAFTVWILTFYTFSKFKDYVTPDQLCPSLGEIEGISGKMGEFGYLMSEAEGPFWCSFVSAITASVQAVGPLVSFLLLTQFIFIRQIPEGFTGMLFGCLVTLLGMVCFNVGLNKSLQPIGMRVGELMPSAQDKYGVFGGDVIMLVFGFLAGVGATFSEPALSALGDTVHALTKGEFKKSSLIGAVALGVGTGIMIGLAKIRYQLPLWIILIVAYAIAFSLTAISEEAITCVAWDSAGVTTGPVTVPIVLALGGSIAQTNHVAEGFGILACASFGPIIAVLLVSKLQDMKKKRQVQVISLPPMGRHT